MRLMGIRRTAQNIGLKSMEANMGKVKSWLMDMEEDAADMSMEDFVQKHGKNQTDIWVRVRREMEVDDDEFYIPRK